MDARFKGFPIWKYYVARPLRGSNTVGITTRYESYQLFHAWREWSWSTWGPSKEIGDWLEDIKHPHLATSHNASWCWLNDGNDSRIYLRTDAELTLFLLRWS
jgi:hypothetical protein